MVEAEVGQTSLTGIVILEAGMDTNNDESACCKNWRDIRAQQSIGTCDQSGE
jgi:hypothetical protein